jgi:uncharacterized protein YlzI (FlbEa/FlbD family)
MDIILGLGLFGYALLYSSDNTEVKNAKLLANTDYTIQNYDNHYLNNYTVDFLENNESSINRNLNIEYKGSLKPNSSIVNDQWRYETYFDQNIKKEINNLLTNDIGMIKNKNYLTNNIIEPMRNTNDDDNQSDSVFSDDYQSVNYAKPKKKREHYADQSSNESDNESDNVSNVNMKMLNTQQRFMDDVISDYSKSDDISMDAKENKRNVQMIAQMKAKAQAMSQSPAKCNINTMEPNKTRCNNQFLDQYDQLRFEHNGLPEGFNNVKPVVNIFNREKMTQQSPQSNFNSGEDGRYGVTSAMTHGNMQPNFKSKSYGFDPEMDTRKAEVFTRNVELFTGSDQNLQFKHKQEVKKLFSPETNKVDSLTGTPNFTNFFESRYIPSDKRQSERPFEPIRTTPGLNLGYNQTGSTGRHDMYRVLPKGVDQLRVVTKPKVSYSQPVIPGMKGERRGVIGDMIQKTPDRFFYQTPDSMMPNTGPLEAPAIYGKYLAPQTNRAIDSTTTHLNPARDEVQKNTPKYLREGQHSAPSKISYLQPGPNNVEYKTKGQIINQESFNNVQTQRSTTGDKVHLLGTIGNKTADYLVNYDNLVPETTQRDMNAEQPKTNVKGNYTAVPLINFLNYVPEVTLKQILLEDNGKKSLSNVSNSLKGYLFNSINSIKDPTLRNLISEKIQIVNQKGNHDNGYLFNNQNAVSDQNMRNLSQDNVILTTISNAEKGYLFNHLNAIPDPTLRQLVNTLWGSGGLNMDGNHKTNQMFNYKNAIPDTTLRELTQNLIQMTNVTGPSGQVKGYLLNYINAIPDTTMKELTQDKIVLSNITPLETKNYLINYINAVPDETLRQLTENQKYITGQKGNHENNYIFNYENSIPDSTLRDIISNVVQMTNLDGNHKSGYLINYLNAIPDSTLKQLTENKTQILNISPIQMKNYMINYLNTIPDTTLRELTENQKYVIGQKGNHENNYIFNYENSIPDSTLRDIISNVVQMTNLDGNHKSGYLINYINAIPDSTLKQLTENKTQITNITPIQMKNYMINYLNTIPETTLRELSENQKYVIGQKGNKVQGQYYNYDNAIPDSTLRNLTEQKEQITGISGNKAQGQYYNYDNAIPDSTLRNLTEQKEHMVGAIGNKAHVQNFNYENAIPDKTLREMSEEIKYLTNTLGNHQVGKAFNYENGIPDTTLREHISHTKYLINVGNNFINQGYMYNHDDKARDTLRTMTEKLKHLTNVAFNKYSGVLFNWDDVPDQTNRSTTEITKNLTGATNAYAHKEYVFNYENGVPDQTNRAMTGSTKNLTGITNAYAHKEYVFNYENGVPDQTNRAMTGKVKNITGSKGNGDQTRARMDYGNALLNTEKEVIAEGRDPVPVKDNRGPTPYFTEYVFCDDGGKTRSLLSGIKPNTNIKNELFFG